MTEEDGQATFKDILDGQTVHEQVDENTGMSALVITESPDEKKQSRIEVRDGKGKILRKYLLPSGAHLMVEDGQDISAGDVLAKIPRETAKVLPVPTGATLRPPAVPPLPGRRIWRVGLPLPVVRRALAALRNCPCEHSRRDELRVDPPTVFETEQPH
jgi:hypothetical protein